MDKGKVKSVLNLPPYFIVIFNVMESTEANSTVVYGKLKYKSSLFY
jgi:hypothetical protein